jgi:hypothetical protein
MPNVNGLPTNIVIGGLIGKGGTNVGGVDTTLTIWGLYHLTGVTVSVCLGALDLGDFVVAADGSVTVSLIMTGSQTSAWSAAQLIAMDKGDGGYGESTMLTEIKPDSITGEVFINIPCVIGQPYVSQGQRLRLATVQDAKTPTGPALGMTRRTHMWSALVQNAVEFRIGTSLTPSPLGNMHAWDTVNPDTGAALAAGQSFSGVVFGVLDDGYTFNGQLCWQTDRPYPMTVCAVSSFVQTQER